MTDRYVVSKQGPREWWVWDRQERRRVEWYSTQRECEAHVMRLNYA